MRFKIDKQCWRDFWEEVLFKLALIIAGLIVIILIASVLLFLYISGQ